MGPASTNTISTHLHYVFDYSSAECDRNSFETFFFFMNVINFTNQRDIYFFLLNLKNYSLSKE